MVRFSVSLDDEQNEWVEQRAEELSGSKTQVVGMAIDAVRRNEIQLGTGIEREDTGETPTIEDRFEALEARVADLEAAIENGAESPSKGSKTSETDATPSSEVDPTDTDREASSSSDSSNNHTGQDSDDPEEDAVQAFIRREVNDKASPEEITACWEFLKQRGTANPKAFKNRFAPESCTSEADVDTWWEDGTKPVLEQLPGVKPPEDDGRFYRFTY
jgi:predicted transcriptional regulator